MYYKSHGDDGNGENVIAFTSYDDKRMKLLALRKAQINKRLNDAASFPKTAVYFTIVTLVLVGQADVSIQIALLVYNTPLNYVCSGIVTGLICFLSAFFLFRLIGNRTYEVYMTSFFLNVFVIAVGCAVQITLNCISLALYEGCSPNKDCNRYVDLRELNIALIALAAFSSLICTVFIIIINVTFSDCYNNVSDEIRPV